jgi:hypothetical protein
MYVLFKTLYADYGGFKAFAPVLVGSQWKAFAEVDAKVGKELVEKYPLCEEITPEVYAELKKKLGGEEIAYRQFRTRQADASRNPNAVYAEAKPAEPAPPSDPKELLQVEEVQVERLLEEAPAPKPKAKAKKSKAPKPSEK